MSVDAKAALGEKNYIYGCARCCVIMKLIAHVQDSEEMPHSQDLRQASGNHSVEGTDRTLRILHVYFTVFTQ